MPQYETNPLFTVTEDGDVVAPDAGTDFETESFDAEDIHFSRGPNWYDARNPLIIRAMGLLVESNRRRGAGLMHPENPVAKRLDSKYSGGRIGVAERSDDFYGQFSQTLKQACGACALSKECNIAFKPGEFMAKYPKAKDHVKLKRRIRKDPEEKC